MILEVRNQLVEEALDLVPWQARRFPRLPRGITTDDLESAGQEALIHAATTWDVQSGAPWRTWARACIRNAMTNVIRQARTRRSVALEIETEDGELIPRPDPRAGDPAELASIREPLAPARAKRAHVAIKGAPDPAAIANRAARLRETMFAAIEESDVAAVVKAVAEKAKGGDLRAARLLFDVLAPARAGATIIHQQAIVVRPEDLT